MLREKKIQSQLNKTSQERFMITVITAPQMRLCLRVILYPPHTHSLCLIYFPELLHLGHGDRAALTEGD